MLPGAVPPAVPIPSGLLSPLDYMLQVLNDPKVEPERRDRMAQAAAPFFHARPAAGAELGKKDRQKQAAHDRAVGKLAPPAPPGTATKLN